MLSKQRYRNTLSFCLCLSYTCNVDINMYGYTKVTKRLYMYLPENGNVSVQNKIRTRTSFAPRISKMQLSSFLLVLVAFVKAFPAFQLPWNLPPNYKCKYEIRFCCPFQPIVILLFSESIILSNEFN